MTETTPKILIVDDREENLVALERTLSGLDVEFVRALSGNDALIRTLEHDFAIALVDVQMSDMDGFETVELMRQEERTRDLPVIFLSAIYKEDYYQIKGIQAGAVDFITKPIVPEILIGKVQVFLELYLKERALTAEIERRVQYEKALLESETQQVELNTRLREKLDELSASEERFKSLVLTIPDIVYRIDPEGHFTYVNQAIEHFGYETKDLIGAHFSEIVYPEDVEQVSRRHILPRCKGTQTGDDHSPMLFDERRTGSRRTIGLEVRVLTKEGARLKRRTEDSAHEAVPVEINSAGLYGIQEDDSQRRVFIGTVGVIRDVSKRKEQEESIHRQSRLLDGINRIFREAMTCDTLKAVATAALETAQEITESGMGLLGEINPDGTFSAHTLSESGWRACNMTEETVPVHLTHMEIRGMLGAPLTSGKSLVVNGMENYADGVGFPDGHPEITTFLGVPLVQGERTLGLIALANKTQGYGEKDREDTEALGIAAVEAIHRKRAEIALKEYQENLEGLVEARTAALKESQGRLVEAEKLSALGVLVAGIAHEMNNPLMGILNYLQYCAKHFSKNNKAFETLLDAERETKRCIGIVENLLTFSRMKRHSEEPYEKVPCSVLFDRVLDLLKYRIDVEDISVNRSGEGDLPELYVKTSNLQQVFLNVVGNAIDSLSEAAEKRIDIKTSCGDEYVQIDIADTGQGIPEANRFSVFDPFFTTKPPGKGTGLGLSVSRSIVEAHCGEITCNSTPGEGATFTIRLPRTVPEDIDDHPKEEIWHSES